MNSSTSAVFDPLHARSLNDPEGFWGEAAGEIAWIKPWERVLDDSNPPFYRWFTGGMLNTCQNAVDRHVEAGHGARPAIIHDSPVTGSLRTITYAELRDQVARFAGALRVAGGREGRPGGHLHADDPPGPGRHAGQCPAGGDPLRGLRRLRPPRAGHADQRRPAARRRLGVVRDRAEPGRQVQAHARRGHRALAAQARSLRHLPAADGEGVADARPRPRLGRRDGRARPRPIQSPVMATDPLYILYTSGTTGKPKGIVRDNGGHAVALKWTMKHFYDVEPGEVFWSASDVGWVVGHSYIVYAPLLHGCTTIVFEGKPVGTPDPGTFWRVIEQHKVPTLFTAPTALCGRSSGRIPGRRLPEEVRPLPLPRLFLAGERADPDTIRWAEAHLKVPVIDHWWQTETGWAIAGNPLGTQLFPVKYGSATRAMPGYDLRVLGADLKELPRGETGAIYARLPLPPGTLMTLWNADDSCTPVLLQHLPRLLPDRATPASWTRTGYVYVMARTDDIINVAGHRLSTGRDGGYPRRHIPTWPSAP